LADCHHALEEAWWIYLVRSLGFQPEPSSHDWHVQPSCQRTDPLPPERALSVQSRITEARARRSRPHKPACPRNLYKLRVLRVHCQPMAGTGYPPVFHSRMGSTGLRGTGSLTRSGRAKARRFRSLDRARSKTHLPPGRQHSTPMPFRHQPRRKSISLKKDHLEVSANNAFNPSRNLVPE